MKILRIVVLIFFSLLPAYSEFASKKEKELTELLQQISDVLKASQHKDFAAYSERVQQMMHDLEDSYHNKTKLFCVKCKKGDLTTGSLIGYLYLKSIKVFIDENSDNVAKKKMDEFFEIYSQKTFDDLTAFMLNIANDLKIKCESCPGRRWEIIEEKKAIDNEISIS